MNLDIIKKTYLYNDLYEKFGLEYIVDAGYYDNGLNEYINFNEYLINFNEIIKKYKRGSKNALVYITGSFAPLHDGHINSVIVASETLEQNGYNVIGGIFSPDHDNYVVDNKINRNDLNIHKRISIINEKLKDYETSFPLICDMWNGLYNSTAINFTEFTEFLKKALLFYGMDDTELFFVCGGDNARFAKTFVHKHGAIIIDRPGYELEVERVREEINRINPFANIYYANGGMDISSTVVRNESYKEVKIYEKKDLILKVETDEKKYIESILPILSNYFNNIKIIQNEEMHLKLTDFLVKMNDKYGDRQYTIFCLDKKYYHFMKNKYPLLPSKYSIQLLDVSRVYDVNGINKKRYRTLNKNIKIDIDSKKTIIIDDDSVSGGTINFAKKLLIDKGFEVVETFVLNDYHNEDVEIMDLGDLLINNLNGGLVIENNINITQRYPYLLPYVSPYDRASVLNPIEFTLEIIEFNKKIGQEDKILNNFYKYFKNK